MEAETVVHSGKVSAGSNSSRVAKSTRQVAGVMAALGAVALILAVMAIAHMRGGKCFRRRMPRSVLSMPFQSWRRTTSKSSLAAVVDASSGGHAQYYLEVA